MEDLIKRINTILKVLDTERYTDTFFVNDLKMKSIGYNQRNVVCEEAESWDTFRGGSHWGGKDTHCCFKTDIIIPEEFEGKVAVLHLKTGATDIWDTDNPQFLVYVDGEMKCAMDMNHQEVILSECAEVGRKYEIVFYAYSNSEAPSIVMNISVSVLHRDVEKLYYDLKVPYEVASLLREDNLERIHTIQVLANTVNCLDLRKTGSASFYQSIAETLEFVKKNFYDTLCSPRDITVHSIGHTHIDVAWKWPLRQTREKAIRSFKTVLYLMEQYPEYKFMSSQPQLYEFVKEDCPEVYEEIKKRVAEGRWETEGAMWLEADCNLVSGESLIRQILYGKQFFQQEFGTGENVVLWLPDVFGYSAALPQIMEKSGIKYFMTTKIAWNEFNQIPNDVMMWKGIDGTEILTYFITTTNYNTYPELIKKPNISTTYNGRQNANQIMGTWQRFQNKELLQEVLTCYGYGDGGGGPTKEMLEESKRLEKGIPGSPMTRQTFVREFFERIEKVMENKEIPKWSGELYLEFHRGTYTSMARNKRYNRICEFKNSEAEFFHIMKDIIGDKSCYPVEELNQAWKLTLLNQFHDILPGSSIGEVYEDSQKQYEEALSITNHLIDSALENILEKLSTVTPKGTPKGEPVITVFNPLGFHRNSIVEIPFGDLPVEWSEEELEIIDHSVHTPLQRTTKDTFVCRVRNIPMKGYKSLCIQKKAESTKEIEKENQLITIKGNQIETPFYHILLNEYGEFISLYDKEAERELIQKNKAANRLVVFEDRPNEYDAWNIDSTYTEKSWTVMELKNLSITESGPVRTCISIVKTFLDSTIEQIIILYPDSRRIDFKTTVDWKESQLLLKTAFPLDIVTDKATYEIQYGNVERPTHKNTSWEKAKFEVCAHKWADIGEEGYGVALMNDCKYGYDIHESTMRLTLIKSGVFPYPVADQEIHHFTYSLLPHLGNFKEGKVIQEAYDLNCPVLSKTLVGNNAPAPEQSWSMISINQENVFCDVIKKAESNEDIILRMYEAYGKRCQVRINLTRLRIKDVNECDLMENVLEHKDFTLQGDELVFPIKPYEIKTFRLSVSK